MDPNPYESPLADSRAAPEPVPPPKKKPPTMVDVIGPLVAGPIAFAYFAAIVGSHQSSGAGFWISISVGGIFGLLVGLLFAISAYRKM